MAWRTDPPGRGAGLHLLPMKRLLLIAACFGALAVPAPSLAAGCPGEDENVTPATITQAERAMACLVNDFRVNNGRSPLVLQNQLGAAARAHSEDMDARNYFDHIAKPPLNTGPQDRAVAAGYPANAGVGENIAAAAPSATPDSLMTQFINSPAHNANMLGDYKAAGFGFAAGSPDPGFSTGGIVTQVFGTETAGGTEILGSGGGGTGSCPKADKLAAKLKRLKKNDASRSKISKTKKALRKARKACK